MVCEGAEQLCALDVVDSGEQLCQCAARDRASGYHCGRNGTESNCGLHHQLPRHCAIGGTLVIRN